MRHWQGVVAIVYFRAHKGEKRYSETAFGQAAGGSCDGGDLAIGAGGSVCVCAGP